MFNSVSKYLWGSSSDHGQEYTDKHKLKQQHGTEEYLEIQQEEEDWVVIKVDDKENIGQSTAHNGARQQHAHHYHHGHSLSFYLGGHESLSQNSSDADLLDDAAALAKSVSTDDLCHPVTDTDICSDCVLCPLHDCRWTNQDVDRCSDTESLPESVFSACSGRSHATYHPCGIRSEPWVVAPPPCFTGSQVGGLSPVASSPLENLLIEHPSMSVYLSFPPLHPILSNHPARETVTDSLQEEAENGENSRREVVMDHIFNMGNHYEARISTLQASNTCVHAAVHPGPVSPQQLLKNTHMAWCLQWVKSNKVISRSKCECKNKVREYQGHAKGNNRRNKRMCPSGFRSSRFSQHK